MNNRLFKWLLTVTALLCLSLLATNIAAKKPVKPPPEPEDPCLSMDSFSPDYVFYRDTGTLKNSKSVIFLAESVTGCERALVDFPTVGENGGYIDVRYLKYSSFIEDGDTFGRVIWRSKLTGIEEIVWSYDFYIAGTDLIPVGGLRKILVNGDIWNQSVNDFDLSPDTATLVFKLYMKNPVTGEHVYNIRMIDIDYCHALPSGCFFEDERAVVIAESRQEVDHDYYVDDPTWDPLGRRVYFTRVEPGYTALQFIELDGGWENEEWPPSFTSKNLFSSEIQPEFQRVRGLASGIMDGAEYLAVEIPHELINCGYIYLVHVQDCENVDNPICVTDVEFEGTNPSWTKDGKVIHHYHHSKINRKVCSVWGGKVGLYDGIDVNELTDGYFPDGAGGLPE